MSSLLLGDLSVACRASAIPDDLDRFAAVVESWSDTLALHSTRLRRYASLGLDGIAREVQSVAASYRRLGTDTRSVASKFRIADSAAQKFNARIASVNSAIAAWLPTNRDPARAKVAADGSGRLLTFDPRKDGRAVEVFGDVLRADHIAVMVPGMDNDISGFSGIRKRAIDLKMEMERVAKDGEQVAVVMWLGYDTPDYSIVRTISEGGGSEKARAGAKILDSDVDLLRSVNPFAHLTVIGHSYGSVVLGQTMKRGLAADDAIAVGSPGMDSRDREELQSPDVTLWATRFLFRGLRPNDLIPLVPVHGEDPASGSFHAVRFRSGGVRNHSDYFRPGTESLRNIALIATEGEPTT